MGDLVVMGLAVAVSASLSGELGIAAALALGAGAIVIHESKLAREAWGSMKNGVMSLSIGYMVTSDHKRAGGVRELKGIDLFEVSIVPHPANADTRVLEMKSARPIQVASFEC